MRGRRPRGVQLEAEDIRVLEALVRSGKTEQRVARRARILIEMGRQERVKLLCPICPDRALAPAIHPECGSR